jgi:hypothetical protein
MASFHDPLIKETTGSLSTPGFWLSQLSSAPNAQKYGFPILMGEDGQKGGIHSYGGDLYCPNCGGNFDFILIEFEDSLPYCLIGDTSIIEEFDEDIKNCPNCGHKELMLASL